MPLRATEPNSGSARARRRTSARRRPDRRPTRAHGEEAWITRRVSDLFTISPRSTASVHAFIVESSRASSAAATRARRARRLVEDAPDARHVHVPVENVLARRRSHGSPSTFSSGPRKRRGHENTAPSARSMSIGYAKNRHPFGDAPSVSSGGKHKWRDGRRCWSATRGLRGSATSPARWILDATQQQVLKTIEAFASNAPSTGWTARRSATRG